MWVKFRHKAFHTLFRPLVYLYAKIKYGFKTKKQKLKGPHLILFNHPSNLDPLFVGVSFNKPTYFIANDDLFNIPIVSKILNFIVAPIPKQKSMKDTSTIRTAIKVIKEGGNIGVSPEGSRTYSGKLNPIDVATIKFMKMLKVPVVLYTIKGGFGKNPRFAKTIRKGKVVGEVARILSKEVVSNLSLEELLNIVNKTLDVDDTKLGKEFKGDSLAEYMESVFYVCPVCKKLHTIRSEGNFIHCSHCNMSAEYTPQLLFKTEDTRFKFKTTREYYEFQDDFMLNYPDIDSLSHSDEGVVLYDANRGRKRAEIFTGTLSFDKNSLIIKNENDSLEIKITDILAMSILYHNTLIVNINEFKYHLCGDYRFNALKYVHLYNLIKIKEQGDNNGKDTVLGI
jgi:1-acyl-sn-glycerol-3-phosphate acyltransferase